MVDQRCEQDESTPTPWWKRTNTPAQRSARSVGTTGKNINNKKKARVFGGERLAGVGLVEKWGIER